MDGFLFLDKPVGITSNDLLFQVKRKLGIKKIGHTGTLDPLASGLMILCFGKATKLAHHFQDLDKKYTGSILYGSHYDTYDVTGNVLSSEKVLFTETELDLKISEFVRAYEQEPPMYSAIKIGGRKLYEQARKGIEIDRPKRLVHIYDFKRTSEFVNAEHRFYTHVSKGTYVRSLAVDLAHSLKTEGAISSLRRIQVGHYSVDQAVTVDLLTKEHVLSLVEYLNSFDKLILDDYLVHLVKNGTYLDDRQIKTDKPFVVYDENNNLIAYYEVQSVNRYQPIIIF